jgi:hypothetical protein
VGAPVPLRGHRHHRQACGLGARGGSGVAQLPHQCPLWLPPRTRRKKMWRAGGCSHGCAWPTGGRARSLSPGFLAAPSLGLGESLVPCVALEEGEDIFYFNPCLCLNNCIQVHVRVGALSNSLLGCQLHRRAAPWRSTCLDLCFQSWSRA